MYSWKWEVEYVNFPATSRRVGELKTTEGDASAVCDIVKKLVDEGRAEGHAEGISNAVYRVESASINYRGSFMEPLLFTMLLCDNQQPMRETIYSRK